jgi:hypothetical protein
MVSDMPYYEYVCTSCNTNKTEFHKIDERNSPLENPCSNCGECGKIEMVIGSPMMSDPFRLGLRKPDTEFQNLINKIKSSNGVE